MSAEGQARNDARLHQALAALEGMNSSRSAPRTAMTVKS